VIGLVSSVLGVAGGELIVPTLVFGFGADIKTAGTASLLISGTLLTQAGEHDRTKVEDADEPPITCITCS